MGNEPKVSVIVPVFETEDYLGECLDSILAQRLTDIEVLCVDDGSTDGSPRILEDYARRDPRLVIVPQRAGGKGPGTARNTAIQHARGEYISFVDSDDKIHRSMLGSLYDTAKVHDADIVMCTIAKFSSNSGQERYADCTFKALIPKELDKRTFSWVDIQDLLFDLRFVACNKIYRRDFVTKADIRFSEGIFFEDLMFSFRAMLLAERVRFERSPFYINRKQREGATTFVRGDRVFGAITAMEQLAEFLWSSPSYEPLRDGFEAFRFRKLYGYLPKNDAAHLTLFYEKLREYASSGSLAANPYLREWEHLKRAQIQENQLLDFLTYELWETKHRNASLLRQRRKLQRQTRPFRVVGGVARRMKRVLHRQPGVEGA